MAITNIPCQTHKHQGYCARFYTETEVEMAEQDDSRTVQEYHEVMTLFEVVFDSLFK